MGFSGGIFFFNYYYQLYVIFQWLYFNGKFRTIVVETWAQIPAATL
uniref:Uncharacterized protein n=1 Tax=Rhizophora mucronata TaxID=61149 RepID=A0A2P2J754_RHIMU